MGFFNRLTDFGDREQVRTYAARISIGVQQIERETNPNNIKSLSIAIRQDVQAMMVYALKLTNESINCLDVNGHKIPFPVFLRDLSIQSVEIEKKGGYRIL